MRPEVLCEWKIPVTPSSEIKPTTFPTCIAVPEPTAPPRVPFQITRPRNSLINWPPRPKYDIKVLNYTAKFSVLCLLKHFKVDKFIWKLIFLFFFWWRFEMILSHGFAIPPTGHCTLGRNLPDTWSARCRNLYFIICWTLKLMLGKKDISYKPSFTVIGMAWISPVKVWIRRQ